MTPKIRKINQRKRISKPNLNRDWVILVVLVISSFVFLSTTNLDLKTSNHNLGLTTSVSEQNQVVGIDEFASTLYSNDQGLFSNLLKSDKEMLTGAIITNSCETVCTETVVTNCLEEEMETCIDVPVAICEDQCNEVCIEEVVLNCDGSTGGNVGITGGIIAVDVDPNCVNETVTNCTTVCEPLCHEEVQEECTTQFVEECTEEIVEECVDVCSGGLGVLEEFNSTHAEGMIVYTQSGVDYPYYRFWNSSDNDFGSELTDMTDLDDSTSYNDPQWIVLKANHERDEMILATADGSRDSTFRVYTNGVGWHDGTIIAVDSQRDEYSDFACLQVGVEDVSGDALIIYENGEMAYDGVLGYRIWNGTNLSDEINVSYGGSGHTWTAHLSPPKFGTDEMMLLTNEYNSYDLYAMLWNGTNFTNFTNSNQISEGLTSYMFEPYSAFAWESDSGDGLVLYGESSAMRYRQYFANNNSWGAEITLGTGENIHATRLCSDPSSDYIGIIYQESYTTDDLYVFMWNGSEILSSNPSTETTTEGDATTYKENANANIDCVWLNSTTALFGFVDENALSVDYLTFTKSNTWSTSDLSSTDNTGNFASDDILGMRFTKHPTTEEVMIVAEDLLEDITTIRWNGTDFQTISSSPVESSSDNWDGTREEAMFAWFLYDPVPDVTNVQPSEISFAVNSTIYINATVIDNMEISVVSANVTLPNGTIEQITLTDSNSDDIYNNTFNITSAIGTYNITIIANDTSLHKNINSTVISSFIISDNVVPSLSNLVLNSTDPTTNSTNENLTAYWSVTDDNDDSVKNITNWYLNGTSITVLNMPFEKISGSDTNNDKDYSGFENDGTVNGSTWNSTGGYDGQGAYDFDGSNDYIDVGNDTIFNLSTDLTLMAWVKSNANGYVIVKDPTWGPDSYGYTARTDDAGGDTFTWEEIISSGGGTSLWTSSQSADDSYKTAPIGFTFDFYGTGYTNAYVSSNGRIHFTTSSAGSTSLNLPSNSYKLVAPVNEDMYVRTASEVYYKQATDPTRLIIQYNRLDHYSPSGNYLDYEVILYSDGRIKFMYDASSGTYNADDPIGINYDSTSSNNLLLGDTDAPDTYKGQAITFYPAGYNFGKTDVPFSLSTFNGGEFLIINDSVSYNASGSASINDGNWHHLAATYNGSLMSLYVDGDLKSTNNSFSGNLPSNTDPVYIGRHYDPDNSSDYFNGTIDEVIIFNRSLSAEQISAIYNNRTDLIVSNELQIGDNWSVCVTPNDGSEDGTEVCSNNLTVLTSNSAPNITLVILNSTNPATNNTNHNLSCYANITDTDGDTLSINYTWYNNSVVHLSDQETGITQGVLINIANLSSEDTTKGENWTCSVQAYDGTVYEGDWNNVTITITNTAPTVPSANITSGDAQNRTTGNLRGAFSFSDIDSDSMTLNQTKWYNNSVEVTVLANLSLIGSGNTTKGENWTFSARGYDGTDWSSWSNSSTLIITDTAPTKPTLNDPINNTNTSDNTPFFNWTISTDADDDAITYGLEIDNNPDFSSIEQSNYTLTDHNYTTPTLTTGTYYWRVKAITSSANSSYTGHRVIMIDVVAPIITINGPSGSTTNTTPTINVTTDEAANCGYKNTTSSLVIMSTTGGTSHKQVLPTLSVGEHTYFVRCNDSLDNLRNISIPFVVAASSANSANISNFTLPADASTTLDVISNLNITLNLSEAVNSTISAAEYDDTPGSSSFSLSGYTATEFKYYTISAEDQIKNNINKITLKFSYNETEVTNAGISETDLRIYFYNSTSDIWTEESEQAVIAASDYVECNVTHLSTFVLGKVTAEEEAVTEEPYSASVPPPEKESEETPVATGEDPAEEITEEPAEETTDEEEPVEERTDEEEPAEEAAGLVGMAWFTDQVFGTTKSIMVTLILLIFVIVSFLIYITKRLRDKQSKSVRKVKKNLQKEKIKVKKKVKKRNEKK